LLRIERSFRTATKTTYQLRSSGGLETESSANRELLAKLKQNETEVTPTVLSDGKQILSPDDKTIRRGLRAEGILPPPNRK
jgi:hypothetical protein